MAEAQEANNERAKLLEMLLEAVNADRDKSGATVDGETGAYIGFVAGITAGLHSMSFSDQPLRDWIADLRRRNPEAERMWGPALDFMVKKVLR